VEARRRLAALLRDLAHELVDAQAADADFEEAATLLAPLRERLAARARRPRTTLYLEGTDGRVVINEAAREWSAMTGPSNPVAPPLALWLEDDVARAEIVYGKAYEGHPGHVHGGYLAAAFDELFGTTQKLAGQGPVVTGTLTIRYRSPAPLGTDLRFEGRVQRVSGRKLLLAATCHAGDRLVADAEALFLRVDRNRYDALVGGDPASDRSPAGSASCDDSPIR
jgi:acyl-coenzyme A thioesterase PaaI-like protein